MLAAFKLSAVPVNVNFRYVEGELRHLYDDADLVAVIHHRQFSPRVGRGRAGGGDAAAPDRRSRTTPAPSRAGRDRLRDRARRRRRPPPGRQRRAPATTTTSPTPAARPACPRACVWRQEDIFFAAMGGGDVFQSGNFIATPEEIVERIPEVGGTILTTPPLMHVSAQWGVFHSMFAGGRIVFPPQGAFDAGRDLVTRRRARASTSSRSSATRWRGRSPTRIAAANEAGTPYDASSLFVIGSGGAVLSNARPRRGSPSCSRRSWSSTASGRRRPASSAASCTSPVTPRPRRSSPSTRRPRCSARTASRSSPGPGRSAGSPARAHVPLGYYKDEAKTKATFLVVDGERWVLPGDNATVDADGTVVLLGRGSTSINTGGEKVYPEEVETALMTTPDIADVIVVGVPDERWGERVVAVVAAAPGATPTLEALQRARPRLARGIQAARVTWSSSTTSSGRRPASPTTRGRRRSPLAREHDIMTRLRRRGDRRPVRDPGPDQPLRRSSSTTSEFDAARRSCSPPRRTSTSPASAGPVGSLAEIKEFLGASLPLFARTQHMMGLPHIAINAPHRDRADVVPQPDGDRHSPTARRRRG